MPRRIVKIELGLCFLIMFGTAAMADDEVIFDLSETAVRQVAAGPDANGSAPLSPPVGIPKVGAEESPVPPRMGVPLESVPAEHPAAFPGWRPAVPHFDLPSRSFSLFRSPASYGWGYQERCEPTPWKPRGNGIPKRTSCYRMDYAPYQLENDSSRHGPAFYMRYELYPCEECHKHGCHLQRFYRHGRNPGYEPCPEFRPCLGHGLCPRDEPCP